MKLRRLLPGAAVCVLAAAAFLVLREQPARSADHLDSPATKADPTVDIADHYAWLDGNRVVLVMTFDPQATATTKFSDAAQYVIHTSSGAAYTATPINYDIICRFNAAQIIECWAGTNEYVTGDASQQAGLVSADGKFKVFAGPRADPFFFNIDGFKAVVGKVESAAPALVEAGAFNAAGCPTLDNATSAALVTQLAQSPDGGPPVDFFKNLDELAIVVSLDVSLVNKGGPIMSSWVSTHEKP